MLVRCWGIRLGERGKYVKKGKDGGFVAISWNEMGDLSWILKEASANILADKLDKMYRQVYRKNQSNTSVSINRAQLIRFVKEIKKGDIVLVPWPTRRKVLIGRIQTDYKFKKDWQDGCPYGHRRTVEWIKEIDRDDLPEKLRYSVGALLTIFSLDKRKNAIYRLLRVEDFERSERCTRASIQRQFLQ